MKLYPPATLYKKGNDYIVEAYTEPEPGIDHECHSYGPGLIEYEKDHSDWQASKVTLTVHKDSIKNILDFVGDLPFNDETAISYFSKLDMKDFHQALTRGIEISSLLPRLEVRDGFVFLKPEQPVNEAEETFERPDNAIGDRHHTLDLYFLSFNSFLWNKGYVTRGKIDYSQMLKYIDEYLRYVKATDNTMVFQKKVTIKRK